MRRAFRVHGGASLDLPLACLYCAEAIPVVDTGRQREYCSKRCSRDHQGQKKRWAEFAPVARKCPSCGEDVPVRTAGTTGRSRTYCSARCQERRPNQKKPKAPIVRASVRCAACEVSFVPRHPSKRFCSKRCNDVSRGKVRAAPLPSLTCALTDCDMVFVPAKAGQRCCCEAHGKKLWNRENPEPWNDRKRDQYHRRRALKAGASTGRPVVLAEIRLRDGNRCHLCLKAVPDKAWPHPLSPSLDHVVPLSKGGAHDPENVKLAHLDCNVAKGNRGGNEQLLLIG